MLQAELVEELINKYPELTYDGSEVLLPFKNPLHGSTIRLISVFSVSEDAWAVGGMYALSNLEEGWVYNSQSLLEWSKVLKLVDKLYPRMLVLRDELLKFDPERDRSLLKSLGFVHNIFQDTWSLKESDIEMQVWEPDINLDELNPYTAAVTAGLNNSDSIYSWSAEELLSKIAEGNGD